MKVLVLGPGTRGDVAPSTGLATAFAADGHDVTIVANAEYAPLVTAAGATHVAIDAPLTPAAPDAGVRAYLAVLRTYMDRAADAALAASPGAGIVLTNPISPYGHDIAEALGVPSAEALLQPSEPSADYPPMILAGRDLGRVGNRLAGRLAARVRTPFDPACARVRAELGLPEESRVAGRRRRRANGLPVHHGISPAVLPRPADWPADLTLDGYWWGPEPTAGLDPEVEAFLDAGPAPVVVTLGSIPAGQEVVADALRRAGGRVIVQGLHGVPVDGPDVLRIGDAPHGLLLPRAAAVVHHGGAGVTAAALRAGAPSVPVPVHTDQPFWGRRLAALGAGTAPLPAKGLRADALAAAIDTARTAEHLRAGAKAVAEALRAEDGTRPLRELVNRAAG